MSPALVYKRLFLLSSLPALMAVIITASAQAQTAVASAQQADFPRWSDFPVPPQDVPKPTEFAKRVKLQQEINADLQKKVRALVWDGQQPDALAGLLRSRIDAKLSRPVDAAATQAEIDSFAADMRRRSKAPTQIDRIEDLARIKPR